MAVLYFDHGGLYLSEGLITSNSVHHVLGRFRPIVREALRCGARKLVLAHNHPSGQPEPSALDIAFTKNLRAICHPLDLHLIDHLIFSGDHVFSMRAGGLL